MDVKRNKRCNFSKLIIICSFRSARYGPLPHRPTSDAVENGATSPGVKSMGDYYYASTEDIVTSEDDSDIGRQPTVSKRLNLSVGRTRSSNDYGYVDFEQDHTTSVEDKVRGREKSVHTDEELKSV